VMTAGSGVQSSSGGCRRGGQGCLEEEGRDRELQKTRDGRDGERGRKEK
jgi:hypothetical protein